jgi:signal transduction histidine kinase
MRALAGFVLRRHPVVTLAALLAVSMASPLSLGILALVPLYGLSAHRSLRAALIGAVAVTLAPLAEGVLWSHARWAEAAATGVLAAAVVVWGRAMRVRREAGARERELLAERAAADERLRIARELHDAVGHDVSLMVVQAEGLAATNESASEAADAIAALGRRTMGELHRTLKVLRDDDAARAPQPGLGALDGVVDGARAAGVPVTLAVEGAPRELAPALDASAYRIVQEALTNVVRHAGGAPATVTVRYGEGALELMVADEGDARGANGDGLRQGIPARGNGPGAGHGLVGMRERAAAFGGTLEAGPRAGRGFQVHAVLPYP